MSFVLQEIDRIQADAFAADLRHVLIAHGEELEPTHTNTLASLIQLLDAWAEGHAGLDAEQAWTLEKAVAPMPDRIPHWSET